MPETDFSNNALLASLPAEAYRRLLPDLRPVTLELGQTLYRPGEELRDVYFLLDSIISKIYLSAQGDTTELGVIGREGIVGMASYLSGRETTAEAVVINAGRALRLGISALVREFDRGEALQQTLLRFTQAFITQMGQVAVCNRHHTVEQQFSRWLLFCMDRLDSDELPVTHELIAQLLGVRREAVTRAAGRLKRDGLIGYRRGLVTLLDRSRMESLVCECYGVVRKAYEQLSSPPPFPHVRKSDAIAHMAGEIAAPG